MSDNYASPEAVAGLRTLVAFSAARYFSVNSNNPIELILPLFEPIAAAWHGRLFSAEECAQEIANRYDLIVSSELCTYWSGKLLKKGLLKPIENGAAVWNQKLVTNTNAADFAKELLAILSELRAFLASRRDVLSRDYTDAELIELLKQGAISSMFPKFYETGRATKSEEEYVYSRFLQHVAKTNLAIAESLSTLRRAAIVCDLILHSREPRRASKSAQQVAVYFDSPLVMDLIGLSGKIRKEHAKRLLSGFEQLGFVPVISPEMVFEIRNNINGVLNRQPRDRRGPTADAMRKGEFKADFVEATRDRLEAIIKTAGVQIDVAFEAHIPHSRITEELATGLLGQMQSHYEHIQAAERDVRAIRGVFGRRGDVPPRDVSSSKCFFLTSNELLSSIAYKFSRTHLGYKPNNFPIVVTRSTAAALADSILGIASTGNMSLVDMLVSAADATQYNTEVFAKIETYLGDIEPDHASDLLGVLQRSDFSQMAMDLVVGNPQNVTVETVTQLTKVIRTRLDDEARERVAKEVDTERQRAATQSAEQAQIIYTQQTQLEAAVQKLKLRHEIDAAEILRLHGQALRVISSAKMITGLIATIAAIIVGSAVYVATFYSDYLNTKPALRFGIAVICAFAAAIPLLSIPSVGDAVIRAIKSDYNKQILKIAEKGGYDIEHPCSRSPEEIVLSLTRQFDTHLSSILGTPRSTSTTPMLAT